MEVHDYSPTDYSEAPSSALSTAINENSRKAATLIAEIIPLFADTISAAEEMRKRGASSLDDVTNVAVMLVAGATCEVLAKLALKSVGEPHATKSIGHGSTEFMVMGPGFGQAMERAQDRWFAEHCPCPAHTNARAKGDA